MRSDLRNHWGLAPEITFLNHGSFGATPTAVLNYQSELRAQLEAQPISFFLRDALPLLEVAIARGAAFIGADVRGFAFVANATTGVNTALASIELRAGDELLVTNHEYNACRNALDHVARRAGAVIRVITIPLPIASPDDVVTQIAAAITARTRLLLIDHVTSPTAIVMPIAQIAAVCRDAGVEILVDGAHAVGMLDLDVDGLGVDYYTGNFHKWACTPKAAAAFWVAERHRGRVRPLVTSHGANMSAATVDEAFRNQFNWVGTTDPTPVLTIPFALDYMAGLVDGGWPEIRRRNRELALAGRTLLCEALGEVELAPSAMIGSMASVRLPDATSAPLKSIMDADPEHDVLLNDFGIEVPFVHWGGYPRRLVRISAQLYNSLDDYQRLVEALGSLR